MLLPAGILTSAAARLRSASRRLIAVTMCSPRREFMAGCHANAVGLPSLSSMERKAFVARRTNASVAVCRDDGGARTRAVTGAPHPRTI
jgi:hypothetical protein